MYKCIIYFKLKSLKYYERLIYIKLSCILDFDYMYIMYKFKILIVRGLFYIRLILLDDYY